jgi:hypothetical protein
LAFHARENDGTVVLPFSIHHQHECMFMLYKSKVYTIERLEKKYNKWYNHNFQVPHSQTLLAAFRYISLSLCAMRSIKKYTFKRGGYSWLSSYVQCEKFSLCFCRFFTCTYQKMLFMRFLVVP